MTSHSSNEWEGLVVLTRRQWFTEEWDEDGYHDFKSFPLPLSPAGLKDILPIATEFLSFEKLVSGEATEDDRRKFLRLMIDDIYKRDGVRIIRADLNSLKYWLPAMVGLLGKNGVEILQLSDHSSFYQAVNFTARRIIEKNSKKKRFDIEQLAYQSWNLIVRQNEEWDLLFTKCGVEPTIIPSTILKEWLELGVFRWLKITRNSRIFEEGAEKSLVKMIETELRKQLLSSRSMMRKVSFETQTE